jgi:hypothetical protein
MRLGSGGAVSLSGLEDPLGVLHHRQESWNEDRQLGTLGVLDLLQVTLGVLHHQQETWNEAERQLVTWVDSLRESYDHFRPHRDREHTG